MTPTRLDSDCQEPHEPGNDKSDRTSAHNGAALTGLDDSPRIIAEPPLPTSAVKRICGEGPMTIGRSVNMLRNQYLAGYKEDRVATYPTVDRPDVQAAHAHNGTIDDVFKAHPELETCLYNDVKACSCGKPCAFTMVTCNSCGKDLPTETTKSENVFAAFLFGVESACKGFPYTISLRRETESVLIFDDMLQLGPVHLNCIPKNYHIPDWRYLLLCPKESLILLDTMEAELWAATQVFLRDPAYRETIFREGITDGDIKQNIMACFNFPPSQFQLHMQWIVPPMAPFQHFMAETKNHFQEGRAFSISYVRNCLTLGEPYLVKEDTPIEAIIAFYNALGVDYHTQWDDWFHGVCLGSDLRMQSWDTDDFQYVVQNGKAHNFSITDGKVVLGGVVDVEPIEIQSKDKAILQNYGRPYDAAGKPGGTYIQKPLRLKFGRGGLLKWPPAETLALGSASLQTGELLDDSQEPHEAESYQTEQQGGGYPKACSIHDALPPKLADSRTTARPRTAPHKRAEAAPKAYDYSGLKVGTKCQAKSEGSYYSAEITAISGSKSRIKAPIRINWEGYDQSAHEWVGGNRLRSKALRVVKPNKLRAGGGPFGRVARVYRAKVKGEAAVLALDAQVNYLRAKLEEAIGFVKISRQVCRREWAYELTVVWRSADDFTSYKKSDLRREVNREFEEKIAALIESAMYSGFRVYNEF